METFLTPHYWQEAAADIRALAARLADVEARQALARAADHCDRMAQRLCSLARLEAEAEVDAD
jgi:hypothetical protein